MKQITTYGLVAAFAVAFSSGAQAQSLRDFEAGSANDRRVTASVTIPLGGRSASRDTKPRLDFTLERQISGLADHATPLRFDHDYQPRSLRLSTVSLTLEDNPQLQLNGTRLATFGPTLNADEDQGSGGLGTVGWVVLGAGALVGASFLFTDFLVDDIEDSARDGD